jgi:hypothetical protein
MPALVRIYCVYSAGEILIDFKLMKYFQLQYVAYYIDVLLKII